MKKYEFNPENNEEDFRPFMDDELGMILGGGGEEQFLHYLKEEHRNQFDQNDGSFQKFSH